jgi:hypothetical protein
LNETTFAAFKYRQITPGICLRLGDASMGDDKRRSPGRRSGDDRRSGKDTRTEEEKRAIGERRASDRRSGLDRRTGKPVPPAGDKS